MPGQVRHRPKVSEIRRLARLMTTEQEAAGYFGIPLRTFREMLRIDVKARKAWDEGQQVGKVSIRRKQYRLADKHPNMAIFLGKQYLGQKDITISEISGRDGAPIESIDYKKLSDDELKTLARILEAAKPDKPTTE